MNMNVSTVILDQNTNEASYVLPPTQLTTGNPYQMYVRQEKRVRIYGTHKNSTTLASLITLLNVNLENKITEIRWLV
jgi:hypothetical protein